MRSKLVMAGLAALPALMSFPVRAQEAYTTRIEPRPYYGAMVTIEAGVRVFRPLPPTQHVIINPNASTPLKLEFGDTRVYEHQGSRFDGPRRAH